MKETNQAPQWYQLSSDAVFRQLKSDLKGLTTSESEDRLQKYGFNELATPKPSAFKRLLRQFNSPMVYVLLAAAVITGVLTWRGEEMLADTLVILGVVVLNVLLGFFQEGKTEAALESLSHMIAQECLVVRDGVQKIIPAREVVPGDVVILNNGDRVPADLRLFFTREIAVDEAALTGESVPVNKNTEAIAGSGLSPGDQLCLVFSGTFVTRGAARGVAVATGENTEFGKIAKLVKETRRASTPLQRKIIQFTKTLMIAIFILGALNLLLGSLVGFSFSYSFLATIALIVAAVPEMLPMLVTSILALSASAMAKRNALIRVLPAAETLGSTTVICSDKTGTLTKNEMTVVKILAGDRDYTVSGAGYTPSGVFYYKGGSETILQKSVLYQCLRAGLNCSDASLVSKDDKYEIIGDPTEGALVVAAAKAGMSKSLERLDVIPFESERMYMATLVTEDGSNLVYVKGSPEVIVNRCRYQLTEEGLQPLEAEAILEKAESMAAEGLRLIATAYKKISIEQHMISEPDTQELVFLGCLGMIDPPRVEVIEAIRKCKRAGIRTVMITGDHASTAKSIALQLGIIGTQEQAAVTGQELSRMDDRELYDTVSRVSVYARVAPEHKLRIAQALKKHGNIVAMTGDGVNDAPALRAADIGISMGITGTEVSKQASSMVLTDDNFASIVAAVEEGRHAWNNLEKAILYTLPTNGGQALLIMAAILLAPFVALFGLRLPLEPIQILWINLFDSVFLTMPLMMEPKEKGLLEIPPRDPKIKLANRLFFTRVGLVSLVMAGTTFLVYWIFGHYAVNNADIVINQAQTAAFMCVVSVHLGYVLTARSVHRSGFTLNLLSNKWLLGGICITILTDLLIVFLPALNSVFKTAPFPATWWPLVLVGLPAGFFIPELEKWVRRKISRRRQDRFVPL